MRSKLAAGFVAVAWTAVAGSSLWAINALADGLEGARRSAPAARAATPVTQSTPQFAELLGGPEEVAPASAAPPTPECLTFEDVLVSLDDAPAVQTSDQAAQALGRERAELVWCDGVRETMMLALATPPSPPQEQEQDAPRGPVLVGTGEPPGGPGGPGYPT